MTQKHRNRRRKLHDPAQFYRDAATKQFTYEQLGQKYNLSIGYIAKLVKRG